MRGGVHRIRNTKQRNGTQVQLGGLMSVALLGRSPTEATRLRFDQGKKVVYWSNLQFVMALLPPASTHNSIRRTVHTPIYMQFI
jgi:hypothetical protein